MKIEIITKVHVETKSQSQLLFLHYEFTELKFQRDKAKMKISHVVGKNYRSCNLRYSCVILLIFEHKKGTLPKASRQPFLFNRHLQIPVDDRFFWKKIQDTNGLNINCHRQLKSRNNHWLKFDAGWEKKSNLCLTTLLKNNI